MWYEFLFEGLKKLLVEGPLEGLKNFAGGIIGGILLAVFWWKFPKLRKFIEKWHPKKNNTEEIRQAIKEEFEVHHNSVNPVDTHNADDIKKQLEAVSQEKERIQEENRRKEEALRQAEAQKAEEAQRREEIQRQLETQQKEQERIRAEIQRKEKLSQEEARRLEEALRKSEVKPQPEVKQQRPAMSNYDFVELCESGDAREVEEAIMNGANVNARDIGRPALIWAASGNNVDVVEVLINHGADVNATDDDGKTALMCARRADVAEILINHDANVKATDDDGKTALIWAASWDNVDVVKVLINHGADVNAKNNYGYTAIMYTKNARIKNILSYYGGK